MIIFTNQIEQATTEDKSVLMVCYYGTCTYLGLFSLFLVRARTIQAIYIYEHSTFMVR